jgi:hypothetical protein
MLFFTCLEAPWLSDGDGVLGKKIINSLGKHEGSGVNSKETHENWFKNNKRKIELLFGQIKR